MQSYLKLVLTNREHAFKKQNKKKHSNTRKTTATYKLLDETMDEHYNITF